MNPIEELELFAKWRGYLEGRAISLDWLLAPRERSTANDGRPAVIDAHDEEITAAIQAARTLEQLRALGPKGKEHARVLTENFITRGPEANKRLRRGGLRSGLTGALRQSQHKQKLQDALDAYQTLRRPKIKR